jgi:hypothetical protein
MRWAGEKLNANGLLVGRPEGRRPPGRPRHRWVDDITMDFGDTGYGLLTGLVWLRTGSSGVLFWHGPSGSIKCSKILE